MDAFGMGLWKLYVVCRVHVCVHKGTSEAEQEGLSEWEATWKSRGHTLGEEKARGSWK